jgi:ubiquinone/menaquinone biosynthesis C-methylase UbiE
MAWLENIKSYKRKQNFEPGFLGLFVNPFYFARKGLFQHIQSLSKYIGGRILDVGCGQKPYKHLFSFDEYIGMDIENPGHDHSNEQIDIFYDGHTFPFSDNIYDSVICNQVLEHVFNPDHFLKEVNRVLKPRGYFLLTVPFVWDEHEQPNDYARYSSYGLTHLLKMTGFEVVEYRKSINDFRLIFQLINAYIYKKTVTRNTKLNSFFMLAFMAPINLLGELVGLCLPKNNDLYLDNIVLAYKVK